MRTFLNFKSDVYKNYIKNKYNTYSENLVLIKKEWLKHLPKTFINLYYSKFTDLSVALNEYLDDIFKENKNYSKEHGFKVEYNKLNLKLKPFTARIFSSRISEDKINTYYNSYYITEQKENLKKDKEFLELFKNLRQVPYELYKMLNYIYFNFYFGLKANYVGFRYDKIEDLLHNRSKGRNRTDRNELSFYRKFKQVKYNLIGIDDYCRKNLPNSNTFDLLEYYSNQYFNTGNIDSYIEVLKRYNPLDVSMKDNRSQKILNKLCYSLKGKDGPAKEKSSIDVANLPDSKNKSYRKYNYWGNMIVTKDNAYKYKYLTIKKNGYIKAICIDVDYEIELIQVLEDEIVPPNLVVIDRDEEYGNDTAFKKAKCHIIYILEEPIYPCDNPQTQYKVSGMSADIIDTLTARFNGDVNYVGLYCKNFMNRDRVGFSLNEDFYTLKDLHKKVTQCEEFLQISQLNKSKRYKSTKSYCMSENDIKSKSLKEGERNKTLFDICRHKIYDDFYLYKENYDKLLKLVIDSNDYYCEKPLLQNECSNIARSIFKYINSKVKGKHHFYRTDLVSGFETVVTLKRGIISREKSLKKMKHFFDIFKSEYKENLETIFNWGTLNNHKLKKYCPNVISNLIKLTGFRERLVYTYITFLREFYNKNKYLGEFHELPEVQDKLKKIKEAEIVIKEFSGITFKYENNVSSDIRKEVEIFAEAEKKNDNIDYVELVKVKTNKLDNESLFKNNDIKNGVRDIITSDMFKISIYFHKLYLIKKYFKYGNQLLSKYDDIIFKIAKAYILNILKLISNVEKRNIKRMLIVDYNEKHLDLINYLVDYFRDIKCICNKTKDIDIDIKAA